MSTEPIPRGRGSVWGTVLAVLWGFLGVRRQSDFQQDVSRLSPVHILVVGLLMGLLFVALLMAIVFWVVG